MDETEEVHKSNHSQMFFKIGVLKNFAIFTGKYLCQSLFLIKLQAFKFVKKRLQHRSFPVNIAKFLRTFLYKTPVANFGYSKSIKDIPRNNYFKIPKTNMPHNPTSVDIKVYALQLKQKSTAAGSNGIVRNFRTVTF